MKHFATSTFFLYIMLILSISCNNTNLNTLNPTDGLSLWGDSVCTIHLSEPQNGYTISFFAAKDRLSLAHFMRGDSIDQIIK